MTLFLMTCFVTLASSRTFHDAAEKLYLSQATFSKNIQTLEREFGVTLVTRTARGHELTPAGRAFLRYAENIVAQYDRVLSLLTEYKASARSRISVYTDTQTGYGYDDILLKYRAAATGTQIEIIEMGALGVSGAISADKNTVCIAFSTPGRRIRGTRSVTLVNSRLAALVRASHPLARRPSITVAELSGQTLQLISEGQSSFLYDFAVAQCRAAGFEPKLSPYSLWYSTITEAARELPIAALIPLPIAAEIRTADLALLEISDAQPFCIDVFISEECDSPAALHFFDYVKNTKDTQPQ
ncbi:MAG: LysR family transcriptional regulator [Oscillospiraceae bacterium]|nr:LysR family transcriptional regulator [Oscillospiraceae bacterium]